MTVTDDGGGGKGPRNVNLIVNKEPAAASAETESSGTADRDGDDDDREALPKAEETNDMIDGGDCDNNTIRNGSSSVVLAKPNESGPPLFLTKVYEMVEDPETDPIVSWSINRNSLIVWDTRKFGENLLPKYLKHGHFTSFIRQLNTYGFKKIARDRWEFAHEAFQGGKKHLLKYIKRNRKSKYNSTSTNNIELKSEIENVKKHRSELRVEVKKMTQKMEESNDQLNVCKDRLRFAERRQQQIFNFLSKLQQKKELGNFTSKKRKLLETQVTKSSTEPMGTDQSVTKSLPEHKGTDSTDQNDTNNLPEHKRTESSDQNDTNNLPKLKGTDQNVTDFENQVDREQSEPMQSDEFPKFFLDIEKEFWDDQVLTENLLGESLRVENATTNEELSVSVNYYKIYHDLEDAINRKPSSLAEYAGDDQLVEQTGVLGADREMALP